MYSELPTSGVLYSDAELICATNDTSDQIQWTHRATQSSAATDITIYSNWNTSTFVSTLYVVTSLQGYYTCIAGVREITFALFDPSSTIAVGKDVHSIVILYGNIRIYLLRN